MRFDPHACLRHLVPVGLCLMGALAQAAGLQFIEVPADQEGPALQGAVWSPCATAAGEISLGPYRLQGVQNCPMKGSHLPLVVLSHGYGGSFLGHHDTAEALADAGFVVAAINHSDDNYQLRGGPWDSIVALATRSTDIQRLVDHMLRSWGAQGQIDSGKIGFYGFSRGGYTGLVLAGAQPDFRRLPPRPASPCSTAPEGPACAQMRQRFSALLAAPLAHDRRIQAAVIVDPFNVVFEGGGLSQVNIPIQLWASTDGGDGVTPDGVAAVRRQLPQPPDWQLAAQTGHYSFLAPCSAAQHSAHADICTDRPGFDRAAFHADLNAKVVAFLKQHLGPGQPH